MATKTSRRNSLYGFPSPLTSGFPDPIVQNRAPGVNDQGEIGQIWIDRATQTSYILTDIAAGQSVWNATVANNGGDINLNGTSIELNSDGIVRVALQADGDAGGPGPTATVTINANVGVAILQNYTTAAGGTLVLTVNNNLAIPTSTILATASNLGANDAQMTITRVFPQAGSFDVTITNNGADALNDDCYVTFWML